MAVPEILRQSLCNPIKFVRENDVPQSAYNSLGFDRTLFTEQFRKWENSSRYAYKIQQGEQIRFQFHSTGLALMLHVYECRTKTLHPLPWRVPEVMSTIHPGMTVNGHQLTTWDFNYNIAGLGLADGLYYFVLRQLYSSPSPLIINTFISEPVLIQQRHPNTVYIEYTNSKNSPQFQTIFVSGAAIPRRFGLRVEGIVSDLELRAEDTQYNDQLHDIRMLNSFFFRAFRLKLGHVSGIPEWLWDRVHIAMGCDSVQIEGQAMAKDEGAEWEITRADRRVWPKISVRESKNYQESTFISTTEPPLQPETVAFIDTVDITDPVMVRIIDRYVMDIKGLPNPQYPTYNYISKFIFIYLMVGGSAFRHSINLINPANTDQAYRILWGGGAGGPTHSALGVTFNGFQNQFGWTHLKWGDMMLNNCEIGIYKDRGSGGSGIGVKNNSSWFYIQSHEYDGNSDWAVNSGFTQTRNAGYNPAGMHVVQRLSPATARYIPTNGNIITDNKTTLAITANHVVAIGAYGTGPNFGDVGDNFTGTIKFAHAAQALTTDEALAHKRAVENMQQSLNRL